MCRLCRRPAVDPATSAGPGIDRPRLGWSDNQALGTGRGRRRRMRTLKGPAIFLAQFAGDRPPFSNLADIARWAASLGFEGVQIPSWDARLFDLRRAAESRGYC